MRIAILHLSDMHIRNKDAIHMQNITAAIQSLSVFQKFDGVIIACSGDIAATGQLNEYKLAKKFFTSLFENLAKDYSLNTKNIKLLIAPGNHDMNRNASTQKSRAEVESFYRDRTLDANVTHELNRMTEFYDFSDFHGCYIANTPSLFTRKSLHFDDPNGLPCIIEANLFNSAIYSSDDDNGIHYMPLSTISEFNQPSKGTFSLTIMHHSPDWFSPEQKTMLQEQLYARSNLVLYGHEHYKSSQRIQQNQNGITFVQGGGAWWNGDFKSSSYYAGVIDTISRNYYQYKFVWNQVQLFYEHQDLIEEVLSYKSTSGAKLNVSHSYMTQILADEGQPICKDISRYFVFPNLQVDKANTYDGDGEIKSFFELNKIMEKYSEVMIVGGSGSGKTSLLRMLFLHLAQQYTVLLCGINDVAGKIQKNIIRSVFEDIYGDDSASYALFEQQKKENRIILIDDTNLIKPEHLSKLLQGLRQIFGCIILVSERNNTFDIRERICRELEMDTEIFQLSIAKFYADKRRELMRKVIEILIKDNADIVNELEFKIESALSVQQLAYQLDPDFIVRFVSYYCTHIRELRTGNVNVFSKVFEASIEVAICPFLIKETVGQIKTALGEVAYQVHFEKKYPIQDSTIESIIKAYAAKYDEHLNPVRFLEIVVNAGLLVRCKDSIAYRFKNKDHLAYFVAEAISRRFNEGDPNAEANLAKVVEFSCFSINPTILKFIAYTTGNIRIINLLIEQAVSYVQDWPVYDMNAVQFSFLENIPEFESKSLPAITRKGEIAKARDREKEIDSSTTDIIEAIEIYDYNESDVDIIGNQLIRALMQLNVISSCLTSFSHIMPAPAKQKLITTLYDMPNQIFFKWADDLSAHIDEFVEDWMQDPKLLAMTNPHDRKDRIMGAIQRSSINLLLNLYYLTAKNCASVSTIENLVNSQYITNCNQQLERLMFYEQVDDWCNFINQTELLYESTKSNIAKNMIIAMVYHILLWSPSLPSEKRQALMEKYNLNDKRKNIIFHNRQVLAQGNS